MRCVANEDDFIIFVVVRWGGFQPSSSGCRILTTKERAYGGGGVGEGDACSVSECANDDGAECASLGDAISAAADSSEGRASACAGTIALDARAAGREAAADDAAGT